MIFSLLGTPSDAEKSFVTDQKAIEYLESFKPQPRVDLKDKYPGCTPEAIDFLNKLLVFNPHFRMTLDEAIKHPFMDSVRTDKTQNNFGSKIDFDFDKEDLTNAQLRQLFINEIMMYSQNKQYR